MNERYDDPDKPVSFPVVKYYTKQDGDKWKVYNGMDELVKKYDSREEAILFAAKAVSGKITPLQIKDDPEIKPVEPIKKPTIRRHKDRGDDVAIRLRDMSADDIAQWAGELGVSEKVTKHLKRPGGLGRMAIGNIIRAAVKKKKEEL